MVAKNIRYLGIKELYSLRRDGMLMFLIVYSFTLSIWIIAKSAPEILNKTPIGIVDMDQSRLSQRIVDAFYPPRFAPPALVTTAEMDTRLDQGVDTFALNISPHFERDVLAGRDPKLQLNVDATRIGQALIGNGNIQTIVNDEIDTFVHRSRSGAPHPVDLDPRVRFNPNLYKPWFAGVIGLIDQVTILAVVLTGAALIREREHGTIEHLLVMPVTPFEIMMSKIWSMGVVVVAATGLSLVFVIHLVLSVPLQGSVALFLAAAAMHVFATTSLGIFLATFARTMPQFGLLLMMVLLPLNMLSGGMTPRESMPEVVNFIMLFAPTTHFVGLAKAILFRGAGLSVVWPQFLALAAIGTAFFVPSLTRFRKTIGTMA
jgi:ABC-2 type transport system permease protein